MQFVLMTTLYNETNTSRRNDFECCFNKNSNNVLFEQILILYDTHKDKGDSPLRKLVQNVKHATVIDIQNRPTYTDFFSIANLKFPGKNILVCNSDIYYDDSISLINENHLKNTLIALARWTHPTNSLDSEGRIYPIGSPDYFEFTDNNGGLILTSSADTWIFKAPLPFFKSDFRLGVGHCDTQIANEARKIGLRVINPCKSVKTYHVHSEGFKNDERGENSSYFNPGEKVYTPATEIGNI